jgi:hypothetical protein
MQRLELVGDLRNGCPDNSIVLEKKSVSILNLGPETY